jgi:hypothetical protein
MDGAEWASKLSLSLLLVVGQASCLSDRLEACPTEIPAWFFQQVSRVEG